MKSMISYDPSKNFEDKEIFWTEGSFPELRGIRDGFSGRGFSHAFPGRRYLVSAYG